MERLADLFLAYRWCAAVLIAVVTVVALIGLTRIDFEDEPRTIYEQQDSDFAELEQLFADFGADDNDILLVTDRAEFFTAENAERLRSRASHVGHTGHRIGREHL